MNKISFVMSMLLALTGVLLLSGGLLLQALFAATGRMVFNTAGGTYAPGMYDLGMEFYLQQAVAIACIVIGAALSRRFCGAEPVE